jgi:PDZ domain
MEPKNPARSTPRRGYLLAATAALLAGSLTASAQSTVPSVGDSVPVQTVVFRGGTLSSGWIDFTPHTNFGIYLPVKINGHDAMALLYGGPSNIDTTLVASLGLTQKAAAGSGGINVELGALTLQNATASQNDLLKQGFDAKILGHPVLLRLGEEVFNQVAVDIDFPHHRVAFRDPRTLIGPIGSIEVPLVELDGERVLPLSVNGGAPRQFELELGNVIGPLMVTPAFAEKQELLRGHAHSQRLSGRFTEIVVSVDHLSFAGIDFPQTPIALIPDSEVPPDSIAGGVGLPLLAKFRLIIDYSHNRLYAIPDAAAENKPIEKDRIGLVLDRKSTDAFAVAFVAPNSPAAAVGFKEGEKIALIDGKPLAAWPLEAIIAFQMADVGTIHTLKMVDGTIRRVKAADFF